MTARAANGLIAQVVNTGGLLQANSARWVNGDIVLDAGPGGEVTAGGQISAQGLEAGAQGGNVTLVGDAIRLTGDARINASGQAGGGTVLVGGDWQGSGSLQQATTVAMNTGAEIKANATTAGDGGKVVLWSDIHQEGGSTTVAGAIEAKGGVNAGAGGRVETSGHVLNIAESTRVNAAGANGQSGDWLLDPVNVTIDTAAAGVIQTALVGSNVMVTTNGTAAPFPGFTNERVGESGSGGDITVNAPITWSNNVLSLHADGNITINSVLTYQSGNTGGLDLHVGYRNAGDPVNGTPPDYNPAKSLQFGLSASGFTGKFNVNSNGHFRLNSTEYTLVSTVGQLQNISSNLSGNYALAGDLDASGYVGFTPLGNAGTQFTGAFNGLGHTVSGLTINLPASNYVGLFGSARNAAISNIGLSGGSVTGAAGVGALAGQNQDGSITNSYSTASVNASGNQVGGLVGINYSAVSNASIINSYAAGNVVGGWQNIGGLVGTNQADVGLATIQNSYALGNVSGVNNIGGLVGVSYGYGGTARISNAYARGSVASSGGSQVGVLIGGLVGVMDANHSAASKSIVEYSYATGNVTGSYLMGGLVGQLAQNWGESRVSNSYATGSVAGTHASSTAVGGLIGQNWYGSVNDSYATGSVASQSLTATDGTGGLVGANVGAISSAYATGAVSGNSFSGALVGSNQFTSPTLKGQIQNAYASGTVNGVANSGTLVASSDVGSVIDSNSAFLNSASTNTQSSYTGFDFANTWTIYQGYTRPLLRSFLTPITVTVGAPTRTVKFYDGTTSYAGSGTVSYSVTPGASLLGTLNYATAAKDVGLQQIQVGGLYSDQQGYLISYVNNMGTVNVLEQSANQSVQIAAASVASSLAQLSSPVSTLSSPAPTTSKSSTAVTQPTIATSATTGATSTSGTTTATTQVAGQSGTTSTTPTSTATTTTETATISVSSQPAQTANLNAANTTTATTSTPAATGSAATEAKPQVTMVSMTATNVGGASSVGVQSIAPIQTPTAPEDQRDPVLAAVSTFKPPAVLSTTSGRAPAAKGQTQVVVPLVQGVLALETVPPKAASQTVDEQRLSGAGNRSRW